MSKKKGCFYANLQQLESFVLQIYKRVVMQIFRGDKHTVGKDLIDLAFKSVRNTFGKEGARSGCNNNGPVSVCTG